MWPTIEFEKPFALLLILLVFLALLIKRRDWHWLGFNAVLAKKPNFFKRAVRFLGSLAFCLSAIAAIVARANPLMGTEEKITKIIARLVCMDLDVSGSMWEDYPSENSSMKIAVKAGKEFVDRREGDLFCVVPFSGKVFSEFSLPPTLDQSLAKKQFDLIEAAGGSTLGGLTAIGEGIWTSLVFLIRDAMPPKLKLDVIELRKATESDKLGAYALNLARTLGPLRHAFIVILTDGENNSGIDPVKVLSLAARLNVKTYIISTEPNRFPELERGVLKTGGIYFYAKSMDQSREFYDQIDKIEKKEFVIERTSAKKSFRRHFSQAALRLLGLAFVLKALVLKVP